MSTPSKKFKKKLLPIKQELMKEIVSYFKNGNFEMTKETIIPYQMSFGTFDGRFDMIKGDETNFRLYFKERDFGTVMRFKADEDVEIENEIPFLTKLLDYVDMDYRETHNGKSHIA